MISDRILKLAKDITSASRLDSKLRSKINAELSKYLDGNTYYVKAEHGLQKAIQILNDFGLEQDGVEHSHLFAQDSGRMSLDLAFSNQADPFSPNSISNSVLVLSFTKMQSGRFEVLAYLS